MNANTTALLPEEFVHHDFGMSDPWTVFKNVCLPNAIACRVFNGHQIDAIANVLVITTVSLSHTTEVGRARDNLLGQVVALNTRRSSLCLLNNMRQFVSKQTSARACVRTIEPVAKGNMMANGVSRRV
ncbi:hypothetical protein BCT27_13645 [Enterovibrio norvegicus]|nr:hypothetical protein BCT27_13645 [Enterovibrio norvegicus]